MSAFWSQLLFAVVGIIVMAAAALYHFVLDGSLPAKSSFMLDLERARALARAGGADRPHSIEVEFLAIDEIPKMGAIAGLNRMPLRMVRTSFQLRSDWGNTVIDVGMDRNVSARFQSGLIDFDDDSLMRIRAAIQRARIIAVTHEHPDHMGLLLRLSDLEERLDRLRLTEAQIFAAALYTSNTEQLGFLNSVEPLPDDGPQLIAPGIVMIPAAGHT
ncbi:MAG: MBL fold metallo-hydrolase, partial [Pseudomonadota bacterium]